MHQVNAKSPLKLFEYDGDCFLLKKKNTFAKITNIENGSVFKLCEDGETLFVTCETDPADCGLIGHECQVNYESQKVIDFCYIYFSCCSDSAYCHLYDLKETVGNGVEVVQHLVNQWKDSIRFVKSTCSFYSVSSQIIFLGFVTETYNEDGISRFIEEYREYENDLVRYSMPSMITNLTKKNHRYILGMLPILELFLQKKIYFEGQVYDFKCYVSSDNEYKMKFVNGLLQ